MSTIRCAEKLNLCAPLAPDIPEYGARKFGRCFEIGGNKLLRAERPTRIW
jgi:hypothetical protein